MTLSIRCFTARLTVAGCVVTLGLATAQGSIVQAQTSPDNPNPETTSPSPESPDPQADDTTPSGETASRFACQLYNGQYTVMYAPSSQPGQLYPWAVPQDMGRTWPAERRCQEISARLESYRPDGLLTLDTGVENGYNIVCVTTQTVPGCRIVFTVPPGQDPSLTRNQVFENLASADQGQPTQGVNTFVSNDSHIIDQIGDLLGLPSSASTDSGYSGINLRPFLAPSDGGTGTRLTEERAVPSGRLLNPENFR
jgi:hypothetical protein